MSGHEIGAPANVVGRTPLGALPADASGLSQAKATRRLASTGPNELAAAGRRTLALAERPLDGAEVVSEADEHDLELLGFLVFSDPPKSDAAEAVDRLQRLGVRVKLLTGDHAHSATRLCAEVGLTVAAS